MFEEAMSKRMRIGDLTERAEVTPRTVRYYESIGLIPRGEREGNGQHYYTEETLARLRKIDQLKRLGLSLDEVGDVIDLYFTDPSGVRAPRSTRRSARCSSSVPICRLISGASNSGSRRPNTPSFFVQKMT
jgi:DNA-binding transcriptional MerR regulator